MCLRNRGFAASLEVRKLYPFIDDPEAEANNLIRVVDESGEDYLYPARLFRKLALPPVTSMTSSRMLGGNGPPCFRRLFK